MKIGQYSFGTGDRFGCQGRAQLDAIIRAKANGCPVTPVWNKSHREHGIVGTSPRDVRIEAENAVEAGGWTGPYFVDADHIGGDNVDEFIDSCDFFTLDVADYIGERAEKAVSEHFLNKNRRLLGTISLPGTGSEIELDEARFRAITEKYLGAVHHAAELYGYIAQRKGDDLFVTEVSMDETDEPQQPEELLLILKALADLGVPLQTIAPKFSGCFYKGIDYIGDTDAFREEFRCDLAVIRLAVEEFGLPENLKLSIHSGSDKFSLYPIIREALGDTDAGLHLKTAGTTWLEELIGLALSGGAGLQIAVEIYCRALERMDELCAPYATVIDIDPAELPSAREVQSWSGRDYAGALRHDPTSESYNEHLRQLLHVGYKVAAEMGERYLDALEDNREVVSANVTENLYARHMAALFPGIA